MHLARIAGLAGLWLALATAGRAQDLRDAGILRRYSAGTLLGLAVGVIPAARAAKLEPIEALRTS